MTEKEISHGKKKTNKKLHKQKKTTSQTTLKNSSEVYLFSVTVPALLRPPARLLESLQPLCLPVQLRLLRLQLALQQSDLQLQLEDQERQWRLNHIDQTLSKWQISILSQ